MPLVEMKSIADIASPCRIINVHLPPYRLLPYSIVFDLLTEFQDEDLDKRICAALIHTLPHRTNYKSDTDLWIDLETTGDITLVQAHALAVIIAGYIQKFSEIVAISLSQNVKLTRDNSSFVYYLQKISHNAEIIFGNNTEHFIPDDTLYLQWDCFTHLDNDDYTDNAENIMHHAWCCAELGAEEVGFNIMEKGLASARVFYIKQSYLLQLQLMRIATQHFQAAAEEGRGTSKEFESLYPAYCFSKAWGNVLVRRMEMAQEYFDLSKVTMETLSTELECLYHMNVFALFQHLNGRIDNAFLIEQKIRDTIVKSKDASLQMTYFNAVNLARLYRVAGNYASAKEHLDIAFSLNRGKKSLTDFIYQNVCYSKLYENMNDFKTSLHYWLTAVQHWLKAETPEALGWRAIRVIAYYDFKPRSWLDTELIDKALLIKLTRLIELCEFKCIVEESNDKHAMLKKLTEYALDKLPLVYDTTSIYLLPLNAS
jgi:tetratricopeptide (TPR) repeat protein